MGTILRLVAAASLGIASIPLPTGGARAGLPDQVGACVATSIIRIGTHPFAAETGVPARSVTGIGTAAARGVGPALGPRLGYSVGYANAGSQVSVAKLPEIARSLLNDRVQMCLVASPVCPLGAPGSRTYRVTNERTRETWTLPDPQRSCAVP